MNAPQNGNDYGTGSRPQPGGSAGVPDAELVQAARRGDKRAFVEIVARHQAMVCGVAMGILGDFAASEDAAQEAFLTAWRRFHDLREPERLRAWLAQIARNAALGHLRRRHGEQALDDALALADESPAPDQATANEEEAALVRESLAKLPETYRLPLVLYYREERSVRAVAEALEISEDAVKQRLARGREMLRERMSGLVETVLTRTGPTPVFTMIIAAAIGALAAPAAVAGSVFAAASVAAGAGATATTSAASAAPVLTVMSTSKTLFIAAALITAVCVPIGYYVGMDPHWTADTNVAGQAGAGDPAPARDTGPSFENSALFAEWRQLHDTYGRDKEAMPVLHEVIGELRDPFRRRAFRAALLAEWVQVDAQGGLAFFLARGADASQRRQFFEEWLAIDAKAAVDALLASSPGWESMARDCLGEIARKVPSRLADVVSRLPKPNSFWDNKVREAFAVVAEGGLAAARQSAEAMSGPNQDQALAGIAQTWAKSDFEGAVAWAKALPDGADRDEIIRAALLGKSAVDPAAALDRLGLVPAGGRQIHYASTTGARVLAEAAKADFDATVAWLGAHPGRLGHEDLLGISKAVTDRLNADPAGFLTTQAANGSLSPLIPALCSALLNDGSGQRVPVWEWLKTQPDSESTKSLKQTVLNTAGYQDPAQTLRLVGELPRTPEGDSLVQSAASSLLNGGSMLHRFDQLLEQAPERLRQPLIDNAFNCLRADNLDDPQRWVTRLAMLPEASRARGAESIARAWAEKSPEEAVGWVTSLASGDTRNGASAAIAWTWASKDARGAAQWVASMSQGAERDRSAQSLVFALAERFPREAWDWALSIGDTAGRDRAATHAARIMAARDPATARQWIESASLPAETKAMLQSALERTSRNAVLPTNVSED